MYSFPSLPPNSLCNFTFSCTIVFVHSKTKCKLNEGFSLRCENWDLSFLSLPPIHSDKHKEDDFSRVAPIHSLRSSIVHICLLFPQKQKAIIEIEKDIHHTRTYIYFSKSITKHLEKQFIHLRLTVGSERLPPPKVRRAGPSQLMQIEKPFLQIFIFYTWKT